MAEGELLEEATVKENLTVQTEGSRQVSRKLAHYSLPMIIAVGYRVRSTRGSQFRQWATRTLGEYLRKGFVMDDARLKAPRWDYFDELLERIRDIRSSEKRFYQKVRELFTLAEDYRANEQDTARLFAEVPEGCRSELARDGGPNTAGIQISHVIVGHHRERARSYGVVQSNSS